MSIGAVFRAQPPQERRCIQSWSKVSEQMMHAVVPDSADATGPLNCSFFRLVPEVSVLLQVVFLQ
jgi:hypothetical protein